MSKVKVSSKSKDICGGLHGFVMVCLQARNFLGRGCLYKLPTWICLREKSADPLSIHWPLVGCLEAGGLGSQISD